MWLGTQNELNRYDEYSIKVFRYNSDDSNPISNNTVYSLLCDNDGDIWLGTVGGVNRYSVLKNEFYHGTYKEDHKITISENYIKVLFEDSKGNIWLGTRSKGLNLSDIY